MSKIPDRREKVDYSNKHLWIERKKNKTERPKKREKNCMECKMERRSAHNKMEVARRPSGGAAGESSKSAIMIQRAREQGRWSSVSGIPRSPRPAAPCPRKLR